MIEGVVAETPDGYRVVDGPPAVADYLALRERSGLSAKTYEQAAAGLPSRCLRATSSTC
jgi:hypothetical protein